MLIISYPTEFYKLRLPPVSGVLLISSLLILRPALKEIVPLAF